MTRSKLVKPKPSFGSSASASTLAHDGTTLSSLGAMTLTEVHNKGLSKPSSQSSASLTPPPGAHGSSSLSTSDFSTAATTSIKTLKPKKVTFTESQASRTSTATKLPLGEKRYPRLIRHACFTFGNVYRRLFSVIVIINIVLGVVFTKEYKDSREPGNSTDSTNSISVDYFNSTAPSSSMPTSSSSNSTVSLFRHQHRTEQLLNELANAAAGNIMVAILIRQDYVINTLFKICWMIPLSAPLRVRRSLAKIYEFGGVHSGSALCSVIWFSLFTGFLTKGYVNSALGHVNKTSIMVTTYLLFALLVSIVVTAYPRFRFASHNTFENIHRWGGWLSLALFWVELCLFADSQGSSQNFGLSLIKLPAFWFQIISSIHAIIPWLRFHRLHVLPEKLSDHAIRLHFTEKIPLFVGLRISDSPLREWHSFACIPVRDGEGSGGSVLISNAGDWTRKTIESPRPYYWVKGIPVTGVLCMARVFRKVIIVTTGSGVGPCLAVIQDIPLRGTKCRVVWSTPSPLATYGWEICSAVHKVDPNAVVIDTRREPRPDLVHIAWNLYVEEQAEAVFCISNPKLTRKVVYGLESRGIPAFGPVWDS